MSYHEAIMAVVASQSVDDVAVGKVSEEFVLGFDASAMAVDEFLGQDSLIRVDEVAQMTTKRTKAADLPNGKLFDDDHK